MSIKSLAARLQYDGGNQLQRINKQKLRSLQAALKNSYNSKMVKTPRSMATPVLITEFQLQKEYDKKMMSVEFDAGLEPGDVVEVLEDGSHWMVYIPYFTETAYLRTQIIRCHYSIDIDGIPYWVYFQGPLENDISWYLKQNINVNELNYKGMIYVKDDARTNEFFKRFTQFKIDGHTWEVQVVDRITVKGILEVAVREYFDDKYADLPEIVVEDPCNVTNAILGRTEVRQEETIGYQIRDAYYNPSYSWDVTGNPRVEVVSTTESGDACEVLVHDGAVRGFNVIYGTGKGSYSLPVKINTMEPHIVGPTKVYPYDVVRYVSDKPGQFGIEDTGVAKITDCTPTECLVEIVTGKSGKFTIRLASEGEQYTLDVEVGSL